MDAKKCGGGMMRGSIIKRMCCGRSGEGCALVGEMMGDDAF